MADRQPPSPSSPALRTLVERGYVEQVSDAQAIDAALAEKMVTFYVGYDPTATSLHIGHLLTIMAMRILQRHGHRPIIVVGGGTGMVGDPSGKMEMRKVLEADTVAANAQAMQRQFARFLHFDAQKPHDAVMVNNAAWLLDLGYIEFLREIGIHFTVNRMIATRTYRDRLDQEQPLSFLEFNYQLLQAYDFLKLSRTHDCTVQLGGSDQWGNMIAGVELIRRVDGKQAFCLTFPLLTTGAGAKMGKTERGAVWLDPDLLSPFDYYQHWIGCTDKQIRTLLALYTEVPLAEIDALCEAEGAALNAAKTRLAFEATALLHGEDEARRAEAASRQAFGGSDDWSEVPAITVEGDEIKLVDLVVDDRVAAFTSKRQARQRIEAGAVKINGEICDDPSRVITIDDEEAGALRLQAGKKTRVRVRLGSDGDSV
jgi:tyrosyl-tRNA synthetase